MFSNRSSNPVLSRVPEPAIDAPAVSYGGVSAKTGMLLVLTIATALATMSRYGPETYSLMQGLMWGGMIGGLVIALVTVFKPGIAPITAPLYAIAEGLFIGALSAFFEVQNPGIAINAGLLTMGLFTTILVAYGTGIVRVTQRFRMFIIAAIGGIMLAYVMNIVLSFFGTSLPFLHSGGPVGLAIQVFIVVIAVLSLALDFDNVQRMVDGGADKRFEWYLAFGLLVSLVWLYIEVLRLLARRD